MAVWQLQAPIMAGLSGSNVAGTMVRSMSPTQFSHELISWLSHIIMDSIRSIHASKVDLLQPCDHHGPSVLFITQWNRYEWPDI